MTDISSEVDKKAERNVFLFLVVFLAPIVAVGITAALGFSIWFTQLIVGPPGN